MSTCFQLHSKFLFQASGFQIFYLMRTVNFFPWFAVHRTPLRPLKKPCKLQRSLESFLKAQVTKHAGWPSLLSLTILYELRYSRAIMITSLEKCTSFALILSYILAQKVAIQALCLGFAWTCFACPSPQRGDCHSSDGLPCQITLLTFWWPLRGVWLQQQPLLLPWHQCSHHK